MRRNFLGIQKKTGAQQPSIKKWTKLWLALLFSSTPSTCTSVFCTFSCCSFPHCVPWSVLPATCPVPSPWPRVLHALSSVPFHLRGSFSTLFPICLSCQQYNPALLHPSAQGMSRRKATETELLIWFLQRSQVLLALEPMRIYPSHLLGEKPKATCHLIKWCIWSAFIYLLYIPSPPPTQNHHVLGASNQDWSCIWQSMPVSKELLLRSQLGLLEHCCVEVRLGVSHGWVRCGPVTIN